MAHRRWTVARSRRSTAIANFPLVLATDASLTKSTSRAARKGRSRDQGSFGSDSMADWIQEQDPVGRIATGQTQDARGGGACEAGRSRRAAVPVRDLLGQCLRLRPLDRP